MQKRKLRIFVIVPWPLSLYIEKQKGLVGSSEYNLLSGLVNKGHEVHFIMPDSDKTIDSKKFNGIHIHEFRRPSSVPILSFFSFIFFGLLDALKIVKEYSKPDVFYGANIAAILSYILGKIHRKPNITRVFGTMLVPYLSHPLGMLRRERVEEFLVFKTPCNYMIITDDGTKGNEVAKMLKVQEYKVKFWRNGVDLAQPFDKRKFKRTLNISVDTKIIIVVCRLERWKGVYRIIEAMPNIVARYEKAILLIIGDGEERASLEELSSKLVMGKFIRFLGSVQHNDVLKYLSIADVFASLQDYSNISLSLMEAMMNGVPIVVSDSGTTGGVIKNGENGLLLPHDDLKGFPSAIINLLENKRLRAKVADGAKDYAIKHFMTWDKRIGMEIDLIESLCEEVDE